MKSLRIVALGAFVVLSTAPAHAVSTSTDDPTMRLGGTGSTGIPISFGSAVSPTPITARRFFIFSETGTSPGTSPCVLMEGGISITSPSCFFENDISRNTIGVNIKRLTFDATGVSARTVTCGELPGSPLTKCRVKSLPRGSGTQVTFFDGSIPFHSDFALDFRGFSNDFTFGGTATAVPEPSSLFMFLGGVAVLLARRIWRAH
jgi:hypothetical protein